MPWVVRDAIDDINRAVGRRWQGLDRVGGAPGGFAALRTAAVRGRSQGAVADRA